jgi:hypothetical protein
MRRRGRRSVGEQARAIAAAAFLMILSCGLAAGGWEAGAAAGGPPPPSGGAGCGGQSCWAYVEGLVKFSGNGYQGQVNPAVVVPPPSCWMQPWMSAAEMYQYYETYVAAGNTGGGAAWARYADQIKRLEAEKAQGEWWASNFDGSAGGSVCVGGLPMIQWVAAGSPPPLGWIPPRTLALLALSRLTVQPPTIATNPPGDSYVGLPTFVTATVPGGTVLSVTASIPTASETVVATPLRLVLAKSGPGRLFRQCGTLGSRYSAGRMAATGPGAPIDCGVTFSEPSTGGFYTLTGTLDWIARWNGEVLAPPPALTATGNPRAVRVAEIQSINRGR